MVEINFKTESVIIKFNFSARDNEGNFVGSMTGLALPKEDMSFDEIISYIKNFFEKDIDYSFKDEYTSGVESSGESYVKVKGTSDIKEIIIYGYN